MMSAARGCIDVEWPAPASVRAAFTTRRGGFSAPPWHSLNLATHVGDDAAAVQRNRAQIATALALPAPPCWLEQVHGNEVLRVAQAPAPDLAADAAITRMPGRVLCVLVADCVPLLLCDRAGREVAAVHAGWRGLETGVIARSVAAFQAPAAELVAWIGPAIGVDAYAVGDDLRQRFLASDPGSACAFSLIDGRWHFDLVALARRQLAAAGVGAVSASHHCVFAREDLFYSHRRDGVTGRMAALVWLEA